MNNSETPANGGTPGPNGARELFSANQVSRALASMAEKINANVGGFEPVVVLGVMSGAMVTLGQLLPLLRFPMELDYVHATRYQAESGGALQWLRRPSLSLAGRKVLIVDDILDRGITLAAIVNYCRQAGATAVHTAVLTRKQHFQALELEADFVALEVPDVYVFGFGMDYRGLWRNLGGIYAAPFEDEQERE